MQDAGDLEVAIVGRACRLPGARTTAELWRLLLDRQCSVTQIPSDRWSLDRFGHPRLGERGRSYTWAAGVLDDIWGFDPGAFGLSPREAEQMDPQQRLLLELTWEALEDAGCPPTSLAGREIGVFVGASTLDHGNTKLFDMAATDSYFATGNAASILANRISYVFDLNGPSFTVDTACSSGLVALDTAVQSLRSGRIDTAIVGGVSILASPFQFISFAQATMLSRTGLCQSFSAKADGYVRAEGGVVLVLEAARSGAGRRRAHARIVNTRINSDGRTNGIALPSATRQAQLLDKIYGADGLDPNRLAFVEAHGTGTPVGDPIEATVLGDVLGGRRAHALPIGSIKSNIGHTEAVAGLAGVLKASLSLEHDLFPASLHADALTPSVDFDRLRLAVAREAVPISRGDGSRLAGVSAFGFGGTNAHVVLADPRDPPPAPEATAPSVLLLSAHSRSALAALASASAPDLARGEPADVFTAVNRRRALLAERMVVPLEHGIDPEAVVRAFADGAAEMDPKAVVGTAVAADAEVAFVYSGNGSQWAGMGRVALRESSDFKDAFDNVDRVFQGLSGWSLGAMLLRDDLDTELARTSVAQPLIFAIQVAATRALKRAGLTPSVLLGHSVGEVAAAHCAGALDLDTAVRIIFHRSLNQERVAGDGGMAVMVGPRDVAEMIAADLPDVAVAAYNSSRAVTFSGSREGLDRLAAQAKPYRVRVQTLDIPYPFHSALVEPIRDSLLADLGDIPVQPGEAAFVSTVSGAVMPGTELDGAYWWRNIREPVLFSQAVEEAFRRGARVFVEIGPSAILLSHINDVLASREAPFAALAVLDRSDRAGDPFLRAVAAALSRGARVAPDIVLGRDRGAPVDLPAYPWQRKPYRLGQTSDDSGLLTPRPWHPLIGARLSADAVEWHSTIDTDLVPGLADHVVDRHVLLPGAAFAEMVLAVARDWLGATTAAATDFQIQQPLILDAGAARDIRCLVQPATGLIEIMSRPRLGPVAWQTHATAKILRTAPPALPVPAWVAPDRAPDVTGASLYRAAARSGLHYGPTFRLLAAAWRLTPDSLLVELTEGAPDSRHGLDPAQVDACFHGLVLLYAELAAGGSLKPYVPVAAQDLRLHRPGSPARRAVIKVARMDGRTIVADFTLLDQAGEVTATLAGVRFQAMGVPHAMGRDLEVIVADSVLAPEPVAVQVDPGLAAQQVVAAARARGAIGASDAPPPPDYVLLEGWATSLAFRLVRSLGVSSWALPGELNSLRPVPASLIAWCERLAEGLESSGLVSRTDAGHPTLVSDPGLPEPHDILRALASEHPERSAELLLASLVTAIADRITEGQFETALFSAPALDAFDLGGRTIARAAQTVAAILRTLADDWPRDRALRILQIGDGPLSRPLAEMARFHSAELTVLETDRRRLERVRLVSERPDRVAMLGAFDDLPAQAFDLVLACHTLHRAAADPAHWTRLGEALAPGAIVLAAEPGPSLFRDVVFGMPGPDDGIAAQGGPLALSKAAWTRMLADLQLATVSVLPSAADLGLLCIGQKSADRATQATKGRIVLVGCGGFGETATAFATMLRFAGIKVTCVPDSDTDETIGSEGDHVVVMAQEPASAADGIAARCIALRDLAAKLPPKGATFWVVCRGGSSALGPESDPAEAAVWAFARSLANESPALDLRLVDIAPGLAADVAARRLKEAIFSDTLETELVLDVKRTRAIRFERLQEEARDTASGPKALRLSKGDGTGIDRIGWTTIPRREPEPGEVEIAVEAAGLNFRDVMWGMSLLPDEILEDGYAGATLGLECAGRVVRVGAGVTSLKPGDRVLAFAKSALATHVTVPAGLVAPLPGSFAMEAAATIPVAFLTAYYALITCARLEPDERVLIHGGAGGVGLAALQIARWRGARVFATAGSAERRDLLSVLGAEYVFDSRSTAFVDDLRGVAPDGVDVVLNSLSGESMERSLAVLRPFGRFVELGKRDYVANTHVGLKPFRRNLSYFGVDLDQLLLKDDRTGRDLLARIMGLFAEGALTPLPYRAFPGREVVEAFRLMQRSGHIGKIVIAAPALPEAAGPAPAPFTVAPDRTHVVTGGLSGFGLETARWLADRGARHLVLIGRSGLSGADALGKVDAMRASGVTVEIACVDVGDEAAMTALFLRLRRDMPPIAGIIHAAAVYRDATMANLMREHLDAVLRAKVTGADVLDRLTAAMPLDYFILYSSATTLIGNPGQGAYVAANAYLEGLARRRRGQERPAFAVAWGAIEDAGILARSAPAAINLLARSGVQGMPAFAALDVLADTMPRVQARPDGASVAIAALNWSAAKDHLSVLRSPTYASVTHGLQSTQSAGGEKIAIRDLLAEHGPEETASRVAEVIQDEIARVLRLPREDVSRTKRLMEIGLDSLMGVELAMGLEQRFVLDAPLSTSAGAMTIVELADYVVSLASDGAAGRDGHSERLARRHLEPELQQEAIEAVTKFADERAATLERSGRSAAHEEGRRRP